MLRFLTREIVIVRRTMAHDLRQLGIRRQAVRDVVAIRRIPRRVDAVRGAAVARTAPSEPNAGWELTTITIVTRIVTNNDP